MVSNPVGLVMLADGGTPRIITARFAENTSGGNFVQYSGAADVVSSGLSSYANGDIQVVNDGSGASFAGIALADTPSGTSSYGAIATRGLFIVTCGVACAAGLNVIPNGDHAISPLVGSFSDIQPVIGRAVTGAGSEGYLVMDLGGV